MTSTEGVPPPTMTRASKPYTQFSVHPDTVPIVMAVLTYHEVTIRAMPNTAAGGPRLIAGKPTKPPTPAVEAPGADTVAELGLTPRELQVLTGMSHGRSNKAIGRELYLSEDTVKTHALRLFRKLGATDRAGAVAIGFRKGILS